MQMHFAGQPGSLPFTIDGAVSLADDPGRITMDLPARIRGLTDRDVRKTREQMELPYHQLPDGDAMYQSDDRIREAGVSKGIGWIRVDLGEIDTRPSPASRTHRPPRPRRVRPARPARRRRRRGCDGRRRRGVGK
jgi:hypothetical protein